ncbi:MAG: hypothetical protein KC713_03980 [Candidatus Omnitrophica bacterium]|nr:hypothetical protein [Candidatus Omnitrophota bacterium]
MIKKIITTSFVLGVMLGFHQHAQALQWSDWQGSLEAAYGARFSDDQTKHDEFNMLEARAQLKTTHYFSGDHYLADKGGLLNFKGDFLLDGYFDGKTAFELRELNLGFTPWDIIDVKLGRQVFTWGTGDYLFINDMFPKDYRSFFIGREDEYLKKPSDAIKVSVFPEFGNVDMIVMAFEPNATAKGDRLSFYDPFQGGLTGLSSDRELLEPPLQGSNLEYALRFYRNIGSHEAAFYYFRGFDKNPTSYKNELDRQLFYRRLDVYGASLRGPFLKGIGNAEAGYARSREDSEGTNRLIENSSFKALAGYTQDLGHDWKISFQYQFEQRLDYADYQANLMPTDLVFDQYRHLITQRVTKQMLNQTLLLSLFNFYSPSDHDGYVRPSVSYDINDQWEATADGNFPWGEDDNTEFGMMKRNKNVFLRIRYTF